MVEKRKRNRVQSCHLIIHFVVAVVVQGSMVHNMVVARGHGLDSNGCRKKKEKGCSVATNPINKHPSYHNIDM